MRKMLFFLLLTPTIALSQSIGSLADQFDRLWGVPLSNYPKATFVQKFEDDSNQYLLGYPKPILGDLQTLFMYGTFKANKLGSVLYSGFVDGREALSLRAVKLFGLPDELVNEMNGKLRRYYWYDGNTEMEIILDDTNQQFDEPMTILCFRAIEL